MRRTLLLLLACCTLASVCVAQECPPEPTQNPLATFRLFPTHNIYTFLRLDTRDGRIWQVQWGLDSDHRFTDILSSKTLASGGKPGRFTLYPTTNVYTFLLLDQETADVWQVQWGKPDERGIVPIQ